MGTFGLGILSNDSALDAYDEYRSLILEGVDDTSAEHRVIQKFTDSLNEDESISEIWLGLAMAQLETGRLSEQVRDKTIALIDSGAAMAFWKGSPDEKRRSSALSKFRTKISAVNLDRQKPKKLRPPFKSWCDWPLGLCLSYKTSWGISIIFVVKGYIYTNKQQSRSPVLARLDWSGTELPPYENIVNLSLFVDSSGLLKKYWVEETARNRVPNDRLKNLNLIIPNTEESSDPPYGVCDWKNIEKHLSRENLEGTR